MFRISINCSSDVGLAMERQVPRRPLSFFLGAAAARQLEPAGGRSDNPLPELPPARSPRVLLESVS